MLAAAAAADPAFRAREENAKGDSSSTISCFFLSFSHERGSASDKGGIHGHVQKQAAQGFATHKGGNSQACPN